MNKALLQKGLQRMSVFILCCFIGPFVVHQAFQNEGHPLYYPVLILGLILISFNIVIIFAAHLKIFDFAVFLRHLCILRLLSLSFQIIITISSRLSWHDIKLVSLLVVAIADWQFFECRWRMALCCHCSWCRLWFEIRVVFIRFLFQFWRLSFHNLCFILFNLWVY